MSRNGSPPSPYRRPRVSRRVGLALGALFALVLAAVLVAPVVLRDNGSGGSCAQELAYGGNAYTARRVDGLVQRLAVGVGVVSGCGVPASNVDIRSVGGVAPARAVAVAGDASSVYVRLGVCNGVAAARLLACLRR
ncbi:MAG TPA: hypothetical protein VHD91_09035 [Gaiellaceae bacterium]|nr:hypothetical protein [Gaiellaceae bacterium]